MRNGLLTDTYSRVANHNGADFTAFLHLPFLMQVFESGNHLSGITLVYLHADTSTIIRIFQRIGKDVIDNLRHHLRVKKSGQMLYLAHLHADAFLGSPRLKFSNHIFHIFPDIT